VLFCVKTTDTESAARAVQAHLAADSVVISMQNGVDNAERIRAAAGIRAAAAVVYVAAAMTAPGHVTHSGRGDLILGHVASSRAEVDLEAIAALFERAEVPCRVSHEIRTELWIKMLMNCAYNAISALARTRYGRITGDPGTRALMRRVIEEAVAVARDEGVTLSVDAMTEAAYKLGEAMSGALSSTAQDVGRGKMTEIDSLNGYVVRRGAEYGIAVPANQALHTLVKLLEQGG
jgi:2-dehydropantoate 2-reductase